MVRVIHSLTDDPVYNLAYEAYLTENVVEEAPVVFLWRNKHTIVVGRHQNPWKECQVSNFHKSGGRIIRRLSGGGAVYHDEGNLNFSIIHHEKKYDVDDNIAILKSAMASMGFEVAYSGKNDLSIEGKKFSGHAFFRIESGCCHHGAVLIKTNLTTLSHYLTPSKLKIQTKSVASVRARVTNLSDLNPAIGVNEVTQAIGSFFSNQSVPAIEQVDDGFIKETAEKWVNHFGQWEWTFAESPTFEVTLEERFDWGTIELGMSVENRRIKRLVIYTDANEGDLFTALIAALEGCAFDIQSIESQVLEVTNGHPIGTDLLELIGVLISSGVQ